MSPTRRDNENPEPLSTIPYPGSLPPAALSTNNNNMMNPSSYKSNAEEGHGHQFKREIALARASKRDAATIEHFFRGALSEQLSYRTMMDEHGYEQHCTQFDIYASWDDDKLIHLVHSNPYDSNNVSFPIAKPLIFTGCFMEEDNQQIHPITAKLTFQKEKGEPKLKVSGDLLMYFDHFEVSGRATKMNDNEYQIELRALPAHGVGG